MQSVCVCTQQCVHAVVDPTLLFLLVQCSFLLMWNHVFYLEKDNIVKHRASGHTWPSITDQCYETDTVDTYCLGRRRE